MPHIRLEQGAEQPHRLHTSRLTLAPLHPNDAAELHELELLYGVAEPLWGRGLATELANAMVTYAWATLGFSTIRASTDVANVASTRVLEKAGFTRTRHVVRRRRHRVLRADATTETAMSGGRSA